MVVSLNLTSKTKDFLLVCAWIAIVLVLLCYSFSTNIYQNLSIVNNYIGQFSTNNRSYNENNKTFSNIEYDFSQLKINKGIFHHPCRTPVLLLKYRLIFCLLPKNGITMWNHVIARMEGYSNYLEMSNNWTATIRNRLNTFNKSIINDIYKNPKTYKWAVFVREPLERLLSAVLDKDVMYKGAVYNTRIKLITSKIKSWKIDKSDISLVKDIISIISEHYTISYLNDEFIKVNQHIQPQYLLCDLWKYYKYYKVFNFKNIKHRKLFLDYVSPNLWNEIGNNGWNPKIKYRNNLTMLNNSDYGYLNYDKYNNKSDTLLDFTSLHPEKHERNLNTRNDKYKYFNIKNIKLLIEWYRYDYLLFKIVIPDWICDTIKIDINKKFTTVLYQELNGLYMTLKSFNDELRPNCFTHFENCLLYEQCFYFK